MEVISLRFFLLLVLVALLWKSASIIRYANKKLDLENTFTYLFGSLALTLIASILTVNAMASVLLLTLSYMDDCGAALIADPMNPILPGTVCDQSNFRPIDDYGAHRGAAAWGCGAGDEALSYMSICSKAQYLEVILISVGALLTIVFSLRKYQEPKGPITKKYLL